MRARVLPPPGRRGAEAPTPAAPVAITHVTIVDLTGGSPKPDMTVVITGTRITAITPADSAILPATTVVVDARGKFLIPGLWDMHVHAAWPAMAVPLGELFVANGVTGVRDMWGDPQVSAAEASDSGQRSIEHLTGVALACSAHEANMMRTVTSIVARRGWAAASAMERGAAAELASSYDVVRCRALAARFAHNATWQVPTLTVRHSMAWLGDSALQNDPRIRYIPRFIQQRWETRSETISAGAADPASRRALYRRELEIVGLMNAAGVPILAGTDALNPYCLAGFSLHDEMARLVEAGLTPLEALRAATLNPANFFGATDSLGTVTTGKLADLVLLDADPLADIRNTTRIAAVVLNGRRLDGAARQRMLDNAARATGR